VRSAPIALGKPAAGEADAAGEETAA